MQRLKTRIIFETLILACALSLFFLLCHKNLVALGLLVGTFTGIVCFQLLTRQVIASTSIGLAKIKPYFFLKYLIRYAIMGVVLFLCAKVRLTLFLSTACGLLLIYVVIFLDTLIANKECKIQAR